MDYQPSSRQLAERAEVGFHRRPNRLRRGMWLISIAAGSVGLAWLVLAGAEGNYRIYEAGHVAIAHKSFENDCAQCHTSWAPLERLILLSSNTHSTSNEKCIRCHDGLSHYANADGSRVTGNTTLSCAECHRDHQGETGLATVADNQCIACHSDLKTDKKNTATVSAHIDAFDPHASNYPHPEFALRVLTKGDQGMQTPPPNHAVYSILKEEITGNQTTWIDQSKIRFNHKRHLHAVYENEVLVEGLLDANRQLIDLSNRCDRCHELDADRRYMKPVNYEQHCAVCHQLYYEKNNTPTAAKTDRPVVPHAKPEIVRGFLTNVFTEQAGNQKSTDNPRSQPSTPPLPGRSRLSQAQAAQVNQSVKDIENYLLREPEKTVRDHDHKFFGLEARGGCRFCHEVSRSNNGTSSNWSIVPPQIPQRWMPYSKFSHSSHRNVNCVKCHGDVYASNNTSDVLMPSIQTCRECHTTEVRRETIGTAGARTHCVECHDFHKHHSNEWTAPPRQSKGTVQTTRK